MEFLSRVQKETTHDTYIQILQLLDLYKQRLLTMEALRQQLRDLLESQHAGLLEELETQFLVSSRSSHYGSAKSTGSRRRKKSVLTSTGTRMEGGGDASIVLATPGVASPAEESIVSEEEGESEQQPVRFMVAKELMNSIQQTLDMSQFHRVLSILRSNMSRSEVYSIDYFIRIQS
jgi:hypothetical protein